MDTAAELLAQAHSLQSLQRDQAAEQAFQQNLHSKSNPQHAQRHPNSVSEAIPSSRASGSNSYHAQALHPSQTQLSDSHTEGAVAQQQGALGIEAHAAAAQLDMKSIALDIVESQLPLRSRKPALDWSAQQHLSKYQPQVWSLPFSFVSCYDSCNAVAFGHCLGLLRCLIHCFSHASAWSHKLGLSCLMPCHALFIACC